MFRFWIKLLECLNFITCNSRGCVHTHTQSVFLGWFLKFVFCCALIRTVNHQSHIMFILITVFGAARVFLIYCQQSNLWELENNFSVLQSILVCIQVRIIDHMGIMSSQRSYVQISFCSPILAYAKERGPGASARCRPNPMVPDGLGKGHWQAQTQKDNAEKDTINLFSL